MSDTSSLAADTLGFCVAARIRAATASPASSDDTDSAADSVQCLNATDTSADVVANADSPSFTQATSQITSSAASYTTQADVTADVAALRSPQAAACFQQQLTADFVTDSGVRRTRRGPVSR
jgi:hypothetical protein